MDQGDTSIHAIEVFMTTSQKMMIVLYPVFILLIAMTGYFMLKRALKQVDLICDQVENISYGKDLTKRLPLPKVRDELYELSHKFNKMFERLEESFEKEQQFTADVSMTSNSSDRDHFSMRIFDRRSSIRGRRKRRDHDHFKTGKTHVEIDQ